jgi:hypothetical protein
MEVSSSERPRPGPSRRQAGIPRADDKADRSRLGIGRRGGIRNLRRRRLPGLWGVRDVHGHGGRDRDPSKWPVRPPRLSSASGGGPRAPDAVLRDLPPGCRSRGGWTDRTAAPMRRLPAHDRGRGARPAPAGAALATWKVALSPDIWTANSQVVGPQRDLARGRAWTGRPRVRDQPQESAANREVESGAGFDSRYHPRIIHQGRLSD